MPVRKVLWVITLLVATVVSLQEFTVAAKWERHTQAGKTALAAGDYVEAEAQFRQALDLAKKFQPGDPRFSASLDNLGTLYQVQTKNIESGTPYERKRTSEIPGKV